MIFWISGGAILGALVGWLAWRWWSMNRRILFGALIEQGRKEESHPIPFRPDQREQAVLERIKRGQALAKTVVGRKGKAIAKAEVKRGN